MKQQTAIMEGTIMKGFLTKKPKAKVLVLVVVGNNVILTLQIVGEHAGKVIGVLTGGTQTSDQEYADQIIEDVGYDPTIEVLEKLPSNLKLTSSGIEITLKKPSKYLGPKIVFTADSRLPQGYFFVTMTVKKKDYQPYEIYKLEPGMLKAFKTLMGSKLSSFTKNKLNANFRLR